MSIKLNKLDVQVLDLIADDYYGLWEVCDYFVQLTPDSAPVSARKACRTRVKTYFREGLIDVCVGTMTKNDFRKVSKENVPKVLARNSSWQMPHGIVEVVAVCANKKAETLIAKYPMKELGSE